MKKKMSICILTATLLFTLSACGNSGASSQTHDNNIQSQSIQEASDVETEPPQTAEDFQAVENSQNMSESMEDSLENPESEVQAQEFNAYGLTDAQQASLIDSVKASIEEYLNKYNISAEDFRLQTYDVNDMGNYDENGNYTGEDAYQWTFLWHTVDDAIWNSGLDMVMTLGDDQEFITELIGDEVGIFADDLNIQLQNNLENWGSAVIVDPSDELYDLQNAVYRGIVNFINGLDSQERNELLYNLGKERAKAEYIPIGMTSYPDQVMFDRVISENLQFE